MMQYYPALGLPLSPALAEHRLGPLVEPGNVSLEHTVHLKGQTGTSKFTWACQRINQGFGAVVLAGI